MITTEKFISLLIKNNVDFFCGVPDSCLNHFLNGISKTKKKNILAPNEGSAVSLGIGYHLKTKKVPLIYMQNSGIGNATDPLTSLCPKSVYSIPMILLIGWRGSPNIKDEPQHIMTGRNIIKMLKLFDIKTCVLKSDKDFKKVAKLIKFTKSKKKPVALIIEPKVFSKIKVESKKNVSNNLIFRPDAIECILDSIDKKTKIVSTVGFASRELHQIKKDKKIKNGKYFLMIGGMGHTAMTSLGVALHETGQVICIDGDGSFLMHMGGVATAATYANKNFKYILFDNNSHESVGNQPTISNMLDLKKIALGFGFKKFFIINNKKNFKKRLKKYMKTRGPIFIQIKVKVGTLSRLERPQSMLQIKHQFMK